MTAKIFGFILLLGLPSMVMANDKLFKNASLGLTNEITSPDNKYQLALQSNGNLVIFRRNQCGIWQSGTTGKNVANAFMQADGNFVLYDNKVPAKPVWATHTPKYPEAYLVINNSGNAQIKLGDQVFWDSGTNTNSPCLKDLPYVAK